MSSDRGVAGYALTVLSRPVRLAVRPRARSAALLLLACAIGSVVVACGSDAPAATPPIVAGASDRPREVNLITKDYSYLPDVLDLVPGETVLLHVVNGGLATHEAIIGDVATQDAWAAAEADDR